MSMYKTIFWSDEYADLSTDQSIQLTNGDALVFGESAFSTLDEAVAAAGSNAIVIKVASGKYDSFTVINEGVTMTDVNVVAVDFNGGEIMVDGEAVTVADSGIAADAQASILADLNDSNAGNGKIFVAADLAPETATTLYVGMGEANYVVGQNAAAVYGENAEEVYTVLNNMANVAMLGSTSVNVADGATEIVSFTSTPHYVAGTVAAGGTLKSVKVSGRDDSIVIVSGGFTIGSADSDKKAVVDFQTERVLSVKVERNNLAAFNVNNADMKVGDLWLNKASKNTFANTTLDIKGVFVALSNGTTITDSTVTVSGHRKNSAVSYEDNILSRVTLTNTTVTFNDGVDNTVPADVLLGYTDHATASTLTMDKSTINVEKGTTIKIVNTVTMSNGANIVNGSLVFEAGQKGTPALVMDSSCKLTLDSLDLGANGTIKINILDGFTGGQLIDITGKTGLTNDILEKITFTGMPENLSAAVVDGDIFVVGQSAALEFKDEEKATLTDKVVAKDVTLENSKELAVTDGIHATNSATITNTKDGETEGKLNGGYDDEGKELAAKISAENNIILQNDGHANVDLDAKNIVIANNSVNTLIGNIGTTDTESVEIATGTATADGVTITENGTVDGAIKDATITATNIAIGGQEVSNSTLTGRTAIISDSKFSDVTAGGVVSVGFDAENAADTTLTLEGNTSIGTLYVGKEGSNNEYKAVITGEDTEVTLGSLYNRADSTLEITDGANLDVTNYWQGKGNVIIDGASAELSGINMYVYNNDTTDAATITLKNGGTLSTDANYAIYLGNSEDGPAKGNASMTLESGSSLNVKNLILHADGEVEEVAGAKASTSVSVTDSTVNVSGLLTNNGTVTVAGESELNIAAATGKAIDFADGAVITSTTGANFSDATHSIGGVTFGSGKFNFAGSAMAYDKLALNAGADVTAAQTFAVYDDATIADGASVSANSVYVNGGDITLNGNLTAKGNDGGLLLRNSNKSFNVDGGNVDVAYIEGTRGTVSVNLTNATVKGGHHITDNGGTVNWDIDNSSVSARTWTGAGDIKVNDGEITVTETLTNNGTFTVSGESTLNIAAVAAGSKDIELSEGTILKDSTIMGDVGITGNVTFRGKNVLNNLYDFGEYGAYGNTDWAKWTVEAGSQLFLEQSVTDLGNNLYGVGYGDTVVINGNLTDADAARAAGLTKDDASFYSRTGVRFSSGAGWATSSFTVNNAYVILGTDGSFSNSASNGGSHEITFNNAVVDAAQFYFSESSATFNMSITDSNINATIFMTADTDSVYTLTGSKVVTTGSGNDRYNGNAGALTITDSEITVQTGSYKNSGTITFTDSTLTAASVANTGTISLTVTADKLAAIGNDAYYIINQTGSGAALNNTVSIDGTEYSVGQSFTKDGVVYSVTTGDGNDIAIQAAAKILTVNSSYTEDTPGFGFSKFNKFEDALQAASSEATAIKLESDVTVASGIGYYNLPADMSIIADEHVTLDMAGNSFSPMGKKTLVVGENVEITNMGQMIAYESQVILNGDFAGAHLWTFGWNGDAENGATGLTINETSKVKVSEQLEFRGGDVTINGNITDTAAALGDADQIQLLGTTYGAWGGASGYATKVNLNDTYIKLAQNTIGGAATKFQDGSSAIVTMDNSIYETASEGVFNVASTGLVKAENGSIIYINSGVRASNAGTINITDSTFVSKSEFTNSGTIAVSGDSTINVAKMTGDNAIQILDGATITESSVNGAVDLVSGTINFAGTNAFTGGMLSAGYNNYGDDLTVNITGDFTADNMVAWGGNDTKTVVNIGSEDARTTYNGGTIGSFYGDTTINITNTDVEYHYIYIQGNLNVSDSTLQIVDNGVNTYFRTSSADHRIAIDNTTWNAGSFTNMGSYDASIAGGSAIVDITGGSTFNSGNFTLTTTEGTDYVVDLTVDNSTLNATTAFNVGAGTSASFENGAVLNAETINNAGTINVTNGSTLDLGDRSLVNEGIINVSNSTLEDIKISGAGETGYVRAENAVLSNVTVTGQETRTVNTDFNGGTYTGKVYTGYGLVDGEWVRVTDSESTITGTVDASSVYWQNYGKLTIAEGAELKTSYFSEGSRQVLTVDGTISAGTFRGYNGVVSETGKINAQAAVQFYGNPDTKRQYDVNGEIVVTHDIAYAHNIVVGFNTAKQWYGDGPNDYWNIGGANTEVNVSGEKAKLQIAAGKAGKGTAMIHVDEEGTRATLNISDKAQFLVDGVVINNGNLNIANNATAAITGNVANAGAVTVDASSSFSAGSIVNTGTFNSANAGEMVVLGDMTVTGNIQTTDLILKAGAVLSAGSITVDNLTLAIGSELTLGSGNSTITADYITVTGKLVPENAEFTLVASGWTEALAGKQVWFDANYDGTIDGTEKFTVKSTVDTLSGLNFVSIGGNLYVKDFGAATTGIYIGDLAGAVDGKITTPDGATYTVGVDAFATATDAAETLDGNVGNVESIALDKNDHVNEVAEKFSHISEITIHKDTEIVDTEVAAFSNDLVINNDGHLEAQITVDGDLTFTNTAKDTLVGSYTAESITGTNTGAMAGSYTADSEIVIDNNNGSIGGYKGETTFKANDVAITGGDASNVTVNAGTLELFDTNTFGINAESGIFSADEQYGAGNIYLNGSANMSIDGEIANTDVFIKGYTDEHNGTLTLNGNQTFSGNISAHKIVVAGGKVVTFNQNNVDFNELNIAGSLNADFTQMGSFTSAGKLTGNGVLNTTHNGPWIINESVTRDVTGFAGTVTMENAGAEIVLKNEKSYFSDDAEMVINADQTVTLAKNTAATGIDFSGDGTINVGTYNNALADISAGFTQTLSGNNDSFSGTVNVSEEATLTLKSNIGGTINLDAKDDTGNATTLVLDAADLTLSAAVKGDTNDIIEVSENATLTADNINFNGDVNVSDAKSLTLEGAINAANINLGDNSAALNLNKDALVLGSAISGDDDAAINVKQNAELNGDVSDFSGLYDIADGVTATLSGTIADEINAQGGTLTLNNGTGNVKVNAGAADLDNLNFGDNNVTLGAGDFTNISGDGNIVDFGADQIFGTVEAGTINVTGSDDQLSIDTLTADINITVDAAQTDDKADVTVNGNFSGNISVNVGNGEHLTGGYKLVYNSAFDSSSTITLSVAGSTGETVMVDKRVIIDDQAYLLQLKDNTLVLTKLPGYSNYVVVDGDWSDKIPYQSVMDGNSERVIGYNAASSLDSAVGYIKGAPEGQGWSDPANNAMIELTEGKYTLSTGTLMTDENGVTKLLLKGRDEQTATITGVIAGSDGSKGTTLTLENVRIYGDIYGGGNLVVNNTNDIRSTSNVLAGGVLLNADMEKESSLTINGGYFGQRILVGGSVNDSTAGSSFIVKRDTSVVINNQNADKMIISSNIYGGSWAATGDVVQEGNANILIKVENATQIRGNIFVSGGASYGDQYTMEGHSTITFTGKANLLTFTDSVTGNLNDPNNATTEKLVFSNFDGAFNGFISGFDTITISGDTSLELGRRQTKTANTELEFVINNETGTDAMYIVRDDNNWEFAKNISVTVDGANAGTYVLVDNYIGGFDGFTFSGATLNEYVADGDVRYMLSVNANNQLVLDVSAATIGNTTVTSGDSVDFSAQTIQNGADGKALAISHADVETETDIVFNNTTVEGNITTGNNKNKVEFTASGNTTVNGDISGSAGLVDFTVADGKTTINGQISSAIGNDSLKVSDNAELEVESVSTGTSDDNIELAQGAKMTVSNDIDTGTDDDNITLGQESVVSSQNIKCGTGNDIITIGENATLNAQVISGGNGQDTLILKKGAMVNVNAVETTEYMEINVDAVLNPTDDYLWSTKPVTVTGITELNTDVAGAKMIFANCKADKAVKFDNVDTVLGTATQIAGADTTADASDDVWASLNRVDGNLVVAWGRSEDEVGAALDAFKAQTDLTLGQAIVSNELADGFQSTDIIEKKNNGTLA